MPRSSGRREMSSPSGRSSGFSGGAKPRSTIQSVPPARRTVLSLRPARAESVGQSWARGAGRSNGESASSAGFTRSPLLRSVPDRLDDALVSGAAADVARDALADLAPAGLGVRVEQRVRGHEKAGRADAALRAPLFHERILQIGEPVLRPQPFDRQHRTPVALAGHDETCVHGDAVEQHRARAALTLAAALLRPREAERAAQEVEQARERRRVERALLAVENEGDPQVPVRCAAKRSSGRSGKSSRTMPVACSVEAAIAGAPPSMGSSPIPLAPPPGPNE